jgi:hypothetical protein
VVEQIADLFHTTRLTEVKTQQVARSRGQRCGDIELETYLTDVEGPFNLVIDLCMVHQRWERSSNPGTVLNGKLHYALPADIDKSLHAAAVEKILEYCADDNNRPSNSISFMHALST